MDMLFYQKNNRMKFRILVIIFIGLLISYQVKSQTNILEKKISISFQNLTIEKALEKLSREHDISFSYSNELTLRLSTVDVFFELESIKTILTKLLTGTNINYLTYSNQIILQKKKYINRALNQRFGSTV